ncbi:MAG: hypothetical protein JST82_16360 [Bacteroidetes bacterium]|nr:hypothetical protein [Bacteroidota bacterium]
MKTTKATNTTQVVAAPKKNYAAYLANAWILIPALMLLRVVNEYALNIPYTDDYHAILQFLSDFKHANVGDKFALLFKQHNEHRLLFSRVVYVLYYWITGTVDFRVLIFMGNIAWVTAFLLLVHFMKKYIGKGWNILALILGFALFDLTNFDNSNAAMFGMQNYGIVMLFMFSLYFYDKGTKRSLWFAVLFQFIAIFSSGNGLLASLALILFNVLKKDKTQMIASIATALVFCPLYFIHYKSSADSSPYIDAAKVLPFFFHMSGAHFAYLFGLENPYESGVVRGVIVIALLLLVLPVTKKLQIKKEAVPFLAILFFVLASMGTASIFRSWSDFVQAYSSRFFLYTHLLISLIMILGYMKLQDKKIQLPALIAFGLLILYNYRAGYDFGEGNFAKTYNRLTSNEYYWPMPNTDEPRKIAEQACKDNIYCIQEER